MRKILLVLVIGVVGVFIGGNAMAIPMVGDLAVDFRTTDWAGAYGQISYTVGDVTVEADLPTGGATLYQDSEDGLGVLPNEVDEIDGVESILVTFDGGMWVSGIWITDLYDPPDGEDSVYGERGIVYLNGGGDSIIFSGLYSDQVNGEFLISFMYPIFLTSAEFMIYGGATNNDFSVAGFVEGVPVPEPATLLLLGAGLIGLWGLRRKFRN